MSTGYTPLFASLTTGTLCGKWPDIGLWPIILSLADKNGVVDVTHQYISTVTGLALPEVIACMKRFCEADWGSRSPAEAGARLMLLEEHREWGWQIVNHALYRERARLMSKSAREVASGSNRERMKDRPPLTAADRRSPPTTAADPLSNANANANADKNSSREKTPSKRSRGKRAPSVSTEFPLDFALDDALRAQALQRAADCDVDASFAQFRAHHEARGSQFKNWRQAWVSWIGNYEHFGYPKRKVNGETMTFAGKPVEWQ
jgi:hypothetical protein